MPVYRCPRCASRIPDDALDPQHAIIICRTCLHPQDRAALIETDEESPEPEPPIDPAQPPEGCTVEERRDEVRIIGARTPLYVCEARVRDDQGEIRDGLPLLARPDPFTPERTTAIRVEHDPITGRRPPIVLTDGERHAFGARLDERARKWMAATLRMVVLNEVTPG